VHQIELEMQNEELQRQQAELHTASRRYFDLYDLAPVGYFTVGEADLVLQTNLTACNMLGFERSALVQQPFSRFILRDDMDSYYLLCQAQRKSGQAQTTELRMVRRDGTPFWAQLQTNLAQDAEGPQQLRLVLSDISARKRAQAAQAQSDAQFRALFNAIDQGFCIVEVVFEEGGKPLDCRFLEVNASFERQAGRTDLKGRTLRELAPATGLLWYETCGKVARTGESVRFETRGGLADRCYEGYAFRPDHGHERQVAVLFSDITERRAREAEREQYRVELEDQVQQRSQQLQDLYDQAPCGYHTLSHEGVIVRANQTELALLGYTGPEYVGHRMVEFMTPHSAQGFSDSLPRLLEAGRLRNIEVDLVCKDGSIRSFSIDSDLVSGAPGEPWFSGNTMVDISERKNNAQRLELALMGADLGLWDVQLASGELHLSARVCAMLGQPEGGLGTHTSALEKMVHPDDAPARRSTFNALINGDVPYYRMEYRLRHTDGHWVWVRSHGRVVARDENAAPLRAVGTLQDISQEKHLQLEGADLLQRIESLVLGLGRAEDASPAPVRPSTILGAREQQVIQLIAAGCTSAEIGGHLGIATATAATHRRNLMRKLDLHSAAELTRYAVAHKLVAS
jgi:PAS domain S-box-containing protein